MSDETDKIVKDTSEIVSQPALKSSTAANPINIESSIDEVEEEEFEDTSPGGIESSLSAFGWLLSLGGLLLGVVCIYASGRVNLQYDFQSWGDQKVAWGWVGIGIAVIMQGLFLRFVLEAAAVIIRLLRKISSK